MVRHRYKALCMGTEKTRLVRLNPGELHDEIHIDIFHLARSITPTEYQALSYVWGSQASLVPVRIGPRGKYTLLVTQNLSDALRYLRYRDKPRILWVDAICINQSDIPERNAQVAQMSHIYRNARNVLVWLGKDEEGCSSALEILEEIGSRITVDWPNYKMTPNPASQVHGRSQLLNLSDLRCLQKLLQRPWFERLWVRQEIGLASAADVVCGHRTISWDAFRNSIFWLRLQEHRIQGLSDAEFRSFQERLELVHTVCDHKVYILDSLRIELAGLRCFDNRDRLFGVLSLLHPSHQQLEISPRYNIPTAQVYRDATLKFISRFKSLAILFQCEHDPTQLLGLPSWVPDWSIEQKTFPISGTASNASAYIQAITEYKERGILRAAGIRVAAITQVLPLPIESRDFEDLVRSIWSDMGPAIQRQGARNTVDELCRTLCCGLFRHTTVPARNDLPDLDTAKSIFHRVLGVDQLPERSNDADLNWVTYKQYASRFCRNRCLLITEQGDLALGPTHAHVNDLVYVLLGCDSTIVLRSVAGGHRVIGQSYVAHANLGEVLVGKLPPHLRAVNYYEKSSDGFHFAYFNELTQECQFNDPRLKSFVSDLSRYEAQWEKGLFERIHLNYEDLPSVVHFVNLL